MPTGRLGDNSEIYANLLYFRTTGSNPTAARAFWAPDVNGTGLATSGTTRVLATAIRDVPAHLLAGRNRWPATRTTTSTIRSPTTLRWARSGAFGDIRPGNTTCTTRVRSYELRRSPEVAADRGNRGVLPETSSSARSWRDLLRLPGLSTRITNAFYQSLTPDQYDSFLDEIRTESKTWTHNLNLRVTNTALFDLPAGPVGVRGAAPGRQAILGKPDRPARHRRRILGPHRHAGLGRTQELGDRARVPRAALQAC